MLNAFTTRAPGTVSWMISAPEVSSKARPDRSGFRGSSGRSRSCRPTPSRLAGRDTNLLEARWWGAAGPPTSNLVQDRWPGSGCARCATTRDGPQTPADVFRRAPRVILHPGKRRRLSSGKDTIPGVFSQDLGNKSATQPSRHQRHSGMYPDGREGLTSGLGCVRRSTDHTGGSPPPSQGGDTGSNPVGTTTEAQVRGLRLHRSHGEGIC